MKNLKSVTQTERTFTMKFEFSNQEELMRLKALSIILGNFNPLRNEMECEERVNELRKQFAEEGQLENVVNKISKLLY
jgi:hypothetical protein